MEENNTKNNMTNAAYQFSEKTGEFWGSMFAGFVNITSDVAAHSVGLLSKSYQSFKKQSEPAVKNFVEKCQKAIDKNNEKSKE